jgi:hypothetical protein
LPDGKKTSAEEKVWPVATHVSPFDPEPTAGRKPPALLALELDVDRVAIGCSPSEVPESADPEVAFFLEPEVGFLPLAATEADGCFGLDISSGGTIRDQSN